MIEDLITLYSRDLNKLKIEIQSFEQESNIWRITGHINNSSGNLCLHLIGNLNTYIGRNLGNTGYIRNREQEFSAKDIPRSELIKSLEATQDMVAAVLKKLNYDDLVKKYPEKSLGYEMTTQYFLIHLFAHLGYHLGQINYLRRALE